MFPKRSGRYQSNRDFESLVKLIRDNFKDGKPLRLKYESDLKNGKFTLEKQNIKFNPFDRNLFLGEINGEIIDNQIFYKIEMSMTAKVVYLSTVTLLFFSSFLFLSTQEYGISIMFIVFIIMGTLITYLWLASEIKYLKVRFKKKMENI